MESFGNYLNRLESANPLSILLFPDNLRPGQAIQPDLRAAMDKVLGACKKHGVVTLPDKPVQSGVVSDFLALPAFSDWVRKAKKSELEEK